MKFMGSRQNSRQNSRIKMVALFLCVCGHSNVSVSGVILRSFVTPALHSSLSAVRVLVGAFGRLRVASS